MPDAAGDPGQLPGNTGHQLMAADLPHHRAIVALDIEQSTRRPDPVKAELRRMMYELFETALRSAGIQRQHRDRFVDRGDGGWVQLPGPAAPSRVAELAGYRAAGRLRPVGTALPG